MSGLDIEAVRVRRDTFRDAFARVLRANEPDSDRADDRAAAQDAWVAAAVEAAGDVAVLVMEVDGLRATLNLRDGQLTAARRLADERGAALLEEQTVHAKTFDNFESHAEACLEERTRQLDRYARLDADLAYVRNELAEEQRAGSQVRGWNDELKAERDNLAMRCLAHEGEMREAGAELRDAQAALADALQVIADLRGGS